MGGRRLEVSTNNRPHADVCPPLLVTPYYIGSQGVNPLLYTKNAAFSPHALTFFATTH